MDFFTVLTPEVVQNVSDMLQLAFMAGNKPIKVLAEEGKCSVHSLYSAARGLRALPGTLKVRQNLSRTSFMVAATVALESTGFARLFGYQKVDRNIYSMLHRIKKQDERVDELMLEKLPTLVQEKPDREHLTDAEHQELQCIAQSIANLSCSHLNLIGELDARYELNLAEYLQGTEKPPVRQTQTV